MRAHPYLFAAFSRQNALPLAFSDNPSALACPASASAISAKAKLAAVPAILFRIPDSPVTSVRHEATSWRQRGAAGAPLERPACCVPPITKRRLDKRERRHRSRIGAQHSWAEAQAEGAREREDGLALVLFETAFGADEKADAVVRADAEKRIEWPRLRRVLVAEDEQPFGRP